MKPIKSVFKIGNGPSSSHTVGPYNAAKIMKERYKDATLFDVFLFGSLAFTGKGHSTGKSITTVLPNAHITYDIKTWDLPHPNTMLFIAYNGNKELGRHRIFSIGGGSIKIEGETSIDEEEIYPHKNFEDIKKECKENNLSLIDFINKYEPSLFDYLEEVWDAMVASIKRGLKTEGILPGGLNVTRKAKYLYEMNNPEEPQGLRINRLIASYAYAVSEENASESVVVTAPTCGASGVIPSVLYFMSTDGEYSRNDIIKALAVAGLFGNVIRTNGSISGAEAGCQAEIGSAASMASAALAYLGNLSIDQIEYAAEIAMEHSLGLTCDPVKGLVQIPCIERNAVAANRAVTSANMSRFLVETRKISFDDIVETMLRTGKDLNEKYRETSHGGLATMYEEKNK